MSNEITIVQPLVSVNWLYNNFQASNLIVLNATINKATNFKSSSVTSEKLQIKNARFVDITNSLSDRSSKLPNTIQSPKEFSKAIRELGIHNNSAIVVYDEYGIYSSPRVWWLFKAMGHTNIAVLDGGFPAWKSAKFPIEKKQVYSGKKGNFIAKYDQDYINNFNEVLSVINTTSTLVLDARSENRFKALEEEPRKGLRSGHIPNSKNLPYSKLIKEGKMKSKNELKAIFAPLVKKENKLIFSCGSGITACILALGADIAGYKKLSVYDGSWTEWGSRNELPIEK